MLKGMILLGGLGAAVGVPTLLFGAFLVAGAGSSDAPPAGVSGNAAAVLPDPYPQLYQSAAALCPGLDWHVLEAVGQVESQHNANDGPSKAGAVGPMQFMPATWTIYGDGIQADVWLPPLAIPAAAKMLCANAGGKGSDLAAVQKSLSIYNAGNPDSPDGLAYAAHVMAVAIGADVLSDSRLTLSLDAQSDIRTGVDPRLDSFLEAAAAQWPLSVGTVRTGHATYVEGTDRVSEHACGRAVDLTGIGGQPASATNNTARSFVLWTATLTGSLKPDEVGSPWPEYSSLPGSYFVDPGTGPHVHIAYHGVPCR